MAMTLTCSNSTSLWRNPANGHQFEEGERGRLLNGRPVQERPEWAAGKPWLRLGPIIPWAGGDCPVPESTLVRCLFRGRLPYLGAAIWPEMPASARAVMWHHAPSGRRTNPASDIVAYQVACDD